MPREGIREQQGIQGGLQEREITTAPGCLELQEASDGVRGDNWGGNG